MNLQRSGYLVNSACFTSYSDELADYQGLDVCPYNLTEVLVFDMISNFIIFNEGKTDYYDRSTGFYGTFLSVEEIRDRFGGLLSKEQTDSILRRLTGKAHKGWKGESSSNRSDPKCRGKPLKPLLQSKVMRPFYNKSRVSTFYTFANFESMMVARKAKQIAIKAAKSEKTSSKS